MSRTTHTFIIRAVQVLVYVWGKASVTKNNKLWPSFDVLWSQQIEAGLHEEAEDSNGNSQYYSEWRSLEDEWVTNHNTAYLYTRRTSRSKNPWPSQQENSEDIDPRTIVVRTQTTVNRISNQRWERQAKGVATRLFELAQVQTFRCRRSDTEIDLHVMYTRVIESDFIYCRVPYLSIHRVSSQVFFQRYCNGTRRERSRDMMQS